MFVNYKIFHSRIVRKILTISILKRTLYVGTALKMHIFILLLKLSSCISHVQVLSVRNKYLGCATFPSACLFRDTNVRRNRSPPFSRPLRPPPRRSLARPACLLPPTALRVSPLRARRQEWHTCHHFDFLQKAVSCCAHVFAAWSFHLMAGFVIYVVRSS